MNGEKKGASKVLNHGYDFVAFLNIMENHGQMQSKISKIWRCSQNHGHRYHILKLYAKKKKKEEE